MLKLIRRYTSYLLKEGERYNNPVLMNIFVGKVAIPWIAPVLLILFVCSYFKPNFEQRIYILPFIAIPLLGALYATIVFLWGALRAYSDKLENNHSDS